VKILSRVIWPGSIVLTICFNHKDKLYDLTNWSKICCFQKFYKFPKIFLTKHGFLRQLLPAGDIPVPQIGQGASECMPIVADGGRPGQSV
jgi:hypothetical protein